jgi:hypothetical protein
MSESGSLRPLGGWDLVSRGRFEARHDGHVWTVDLDYFDFGEKLHLMAALAAALERALRFKSNRWLG